METLDHPTIFPNFDSFTAEGKNWPPYNNFFGYFFTNPNSLFTEVYRTKAFVHSFLQAHPNLSAALTEIMMKVYKKNGMNIRKEWKEEVEPLLFVAYKMMESREDIQELLKQDPYYLTR